MTSESLWADAVISTISKCCFVSGDKIVTGLSSDLGTCPSLIQDRDKTKGQLPGSGGIRPISGLSH